MFSARSPWTSAPTASKSIQHTVNGESPFGMSSVLEGPIHQRVSTHVERDCAFHAHVFLEKSSKRDGQHVLSVDGDVPSNPVKMNHRGTFTKLQKYIVGICSALRDVGVNTHVGVKGSVNGAKAFVGRRTQSQGTCQLHSLANVLALREQVRGLLHSPTT